jgi:hypothetical protein
LYVRRIISGVMLFWVFVFLVRPCGSVEADPWLSRGRRPDPAAKTISEIRAAEKRRIPLEVLLKASNHYRQDRPVEVTVIVTNLFDAPLLMNSRMLVNHPLLKGEVSFRIIGPDGKKVEIQRLITPLSLRDDDFEVLARGQSMQRTVDLSDLFGVKRKGIYKVQISYHNEVDHVLGTQRVWKGIVWSEPMDFQLD